MKMKNGLWINYSKTDKSGKGINLYAKGPISNYIDVGYWFFAYPTIENPKAKPLITFIIK